MPTKDDFDDFHIHDMSGDILGGADMIRILKAMEGDMVFTDESVEFGDTAKILIPRGMTTRQVIVALFARWFNDQQPTTFNHTFRYRPFDGAHAAYRQLRTTFGFVDGKPTESMFGSTPPQMVDVQTNTDDTTQVPWGELRISTLGDAVVNFGTIEDDEYGTVFHMTVTVARRHAATVEMLFAAIEMELAEHSIYRGKAIKAAGGTEPKFVDLSKVDPNRVVYADDVMRKLRANLWAPMERTAEFRRRKLPLKQTVLLHGTFGTGKSLAGYLSGQIAVGNGWTAIYAETGDNLEELLELAKLYAPAIVFFEDIDSVASADTDDIEAMLEAFDGVQAKGREVLVVLTTNNIGDLHAAMLRPGRIDVMVEIGEMDRGSVERVIREHVEKGVLAENVDFDTIFKAMEGFTPAFVAQAIERAQKYALLDGNAQLTTANFTDAAAELREQLKVMQAAETKPERPSIDGALGEVIDRRVVAKLGEFRIEGRPGTGRLVHEPVNNSVH